MKNKEINFHRVIWYVMIFSIIGLIIETIYGYLTTGVLESRKGLILGPFCPIYGVGAAVIYILLSNYKSKMQIFAFGALYGSIFEYVCSYVMQVIYGSRFWDYSYTEYSINGRISLMYAIFWGILSLILVGYIKKPLDKVIDKIPKRILDKIIVLFLIFDVCLTILAISTYMKRVEYKYNEEYIQENVLDKIFTDEIMSNIFPNLRYVDSEGNTIFAVDVINKANNN